VDKDGKVRTKDLEERGIKGVMLPDILCCGHDQARGRGRIQQTHLFIFGIMQETNIQTGCMASIFRYSERVDKLPGVDRE